MKYCLDVLISLNGLKGKVVLDAFTWSDENQGFIFPGFGLPNGRVRTGLKA
jgi:hypothetical protein